MSSQPSRSTPGSQSSQSLSPERFGALAHPLRLRLLQLLRADGPSTATLLGRRLNESSGATSYHLRQLAAHGFVEPDSRERQGRERWWRASFLTHKISDGSLLNDPELADVSDVYLQEVISAQIALLRTWLEEKRDWPPDWRAASITSGYYLKLSPEQARAMTRDLEAVVERYQAEGLAERADDDASDASQFVMQLFGFPRRVAPADPGS